MNSTKAFCDFEELEAGFSPRTTRLLKFGLDAMAMVESLLDSAGQAMTMKSDQTPVTAVDLQVELLLRNLIRKEWPGDAIEGEEYQFQEGDILSSPYRWIIDPIDGTEALTRGLPFFGVQLAIAKHGEIVAGGVFFPALKEIIIAEAGAGSWCRRLSGNEWYRTSVSPVAEQRAARGCFTSAEHWFTNEADGLLFVQLATLSKSFRGWGDACGYYLVATGRAEFMIDATIKSWDISPWVVILKESGGAIYSLGSGRTGVVALNSGLVRDSIVFGNLQLESWKLPSTPTDPTVQSAK